MQLLEGIQGALDSWMFSNKGDSPISTAGITRLIVQSFNETILHEGSERIHTVLYVSIVYYIRLATVTKLLDSRVTCIVDLNRGSSFDAE